MNRIIVISSILSLLSTSVPAQNVEKADSLAAEPMDSVNILTTAISLIRNYRFSDAISALEGARKTADSLTTIRIEETLIQAQNGENMKKFCSNPNVIAKERFSEEDFFLYYPLEDKSWRTLPNQLDSSAREDFVGALYLPSRTREHFWSAKDADGIRNIYHSVFADTVWTAPELINEQITTSSDDIFPMLSPDGKQLYFASRGLYGMGGYDLYVSTWNETLGDWGMPVNLGFPYSSPYDDFLYINTADGKYSIFASNRDCPADSVDIYVLEFDSMPVRQPVESMDELKALCSLTPKQSTKQESASQSTTSSDDLSRYSVKLAEVRSLRDSIYAYSSSLDAERNKLADADAQEKSLLAASIISKEAILPQLQDSLLRATKELQKIEFDFLRSGVVIDPEKIQKEIDAEEEGTAYTFTKRTPGGEIHLKMLQPKPSFDYTFQILPEGRFAENNALPDGLIYQIQLFALSKKASVSQLKGLSPVFERVSTTGKYVYSVGLFHNYKDVLASMNRVKRLGFRSATIVAFKDGGTITTQKARVLEKSIHELFQIRLFPADGNSLSEEELIKVQDITTADIARVIEGGVVSYILGPYDSKADANTIMSALKNDGLTNLRLESAGLSDVK